MYFVIIGVLLLVMKVAEFGAVGNWPWWGVLSPFLAAVLWWMWADWSGFTKRRQMDRMDERVRKRREENLAALGMDERGRRGKRR